MNETLYREGSITYIEDLGDKRIFPHHAPNCVIWRFEKDNFSHKTDDGRKMALSDGLLSFSSEEGGILLGDIFDCRVGAVSGADEIFCGEGDDTTGFVFSQTRETGVLHSMHYPGLRPNKNLLPFKEKLMKRRAARFNESNWWGWVRKIPAGLEEKPRIYVNHKTRKDNPFFLNDCPYWEGSVLALFPRNEKVDVIELTKALNEVDWNGLGFKSGGRLLFGQRSLSSAVLPNKFIKFLPKDM